MSHVSRFYGWVIDRKSFWIVCTFCLLLPLILGGALRAVRSNTNDVKDWLPDSYQETHDLQWYVAKFGSGADHIVVVSWEGCQLGDARLPLLAEKLRSDAGPPKLFKSVLTGPEMLAQLTTSPLGLSEPEAIARLEGTLIGPHFVQGVNLESDEQGRPRVRSVEFGSPAEAAELRVGQVILSINGVATPTLGEAIELLQVAYQTGPSGMTTVEIAGEAEPKQWSWSGDLPERQTALIVTLTNEGGREKQLADTLARIREIAAAECAVPPDAIRMGGPPVDNVAIDVEGKRTLFRLANLSFGVGLIMCWLCFRDLKLTAFVFFTAVFSESTSLAVVWYSGGKVDAILLSMPTLIYVLTISGGIHLANYYRDTLAELGMEGAAHRAVEKGFTPCVLAAFTTAVGLASLYISDLAPIRNFGLYSAIGVMVSLAWIFLFLPALLQLSPPRAAGRGESKSASAGSGAWFDGGVEMVLRRNRGIFAAGVALLLIFGYGAGFKIQTTVKLMKLFSADAEIIHHYQWLESKLGSLVPMEVVLHVSTGEHLRIDGAPTAGEFVLEFDGDDRQTHRTAAIPYDASPHQIQTALRAAGLRHAVVRPKTEQGYTIDVAGGGQMKPLFVAESTVEGGVVEVAHRKSMLDSVQMVNRARKAIENLEHVDATLSAVTFAPDLDEQMGLFERNALAATIDAHRTEYLEAGFLAADPERGEQLFRISLRLGAFNDVDYSKFVAEIRRAVDPIVDAERASGARVTYTGVVPLVYKAQNELLRGLFKSYALAFGLIAVVMVILTWRMAGALKALPAGALLMLPNFFPTAMVFGGLAWSGVLIDIGTMMTASVALGVAVDDTVHFLTWFRRGLAIGLDRREATRWAYGHCAVAMTQTTLIAGAGMFVFAASTFTPTQRFGMLMVPLLLMALVGDLILLPALLVSRLGRVFQRGDRPNHQLDVVEEPPLAAHGNIPHGGRHLRKDQPSPKR